MKNDPYRMFKLKLKKAISKEYPTIEKFCFENDIHKSTISRLLSGKRTEFKIKTLQKIAKAIKKKLVINVK